MRACVWNPAHTIAEDSDPRRIYCSQACNQAAYRGRLLLRRSVAERFAAYARTSPEAARILRELEKLERAGRPAADQG